MTYTIIIQKDKLDKSNIIRRRVNLSRIYYADLRDQFVFETSNGSRMLHDDIYRNKNLNYSYR